MKQLARYAIVGIVNNLTGYFAYLFLAWYHVEPKLAMSVVYCTGASVGFLGNRKWTFAHRGKIMPVFQRYVCVHACGYGINFLILYVFVDRLLFPHEAVQAVAIIVVAMFLFIVFKRFVFINKKNTCKKLTEEVGEVITFNKPYMTGKELFYISQAHHNMMLAGDGEFTKKCHHWLERKTGAHKALLTHSCTAALEMAAILANIQPGDEVIMPSYTFVSTANAFVLRGGIPVFVDIRPDTLNIDESLIEAAITPKTKAIVPVHYAGVACEMDTIMDIARRHNLLVIEDAAQGIMSSYKGRQLGSIGHMGTYSFHETKNIISGEGGALLINDERFVKRAEIIREKGTNRSQFLCGQVDKYSWVDIGSSYLPGELIAAFLWAQMESAEEITQQRLDIWQQYHQNLSSLEEAGKLCRPIILSDCVHNAHMYYILLKSLDERTKLISYLKEQGVNVVFHYVPLHSSFAGEKFSRYVGEDVFTTKKSECLVRLPLYYNLECKDIDYITSLIRRFFG